MSHAAAMWGKPAPARLLRTVGSLVIYPRMRAVVWFRVSNALWRVRVLRPLALWVQAHVIRVAGVKLHPAADISPWLMLNYSVGIVVGHEVTAGRDVVLMQGVTLVHSAEPGQLQLGRRVRLMAGSTVLGPVRTGDDVIFGARAVVLVDLPAGHVAVGVPARSRSRADRAFTEGRCGQ